MQIACRLRTNCYKLQSLLKLVSKTKSLYKIRTT